MIVVQTSLPSQDSIIKLLGTVGGPHDDNLACQISVHAIPQGHELGLHTG